MESATDSMRERPGPGLRLWSLVWVCAWLYGIASPATAGPVFDRVTKSGKVRVGMPYNLVPQGFVDEQGVWKGFEIDLGHEIARHMNLTLEPVKVNGSTWGRMLSQGRIDAALCRIRHTRSLESSFDFSVPYFFDSLSILAAKGYFKRIEDLKDNRIAAVQGTFAEKEAMRILRKTGDTQAEKNVVSYPDRPSCFLALGKDKVKAWMDSSMILLEYAAKSSNRFEIIRASESFEEVGAALPQDDSAWRDLVNFTLQDMANDGSFKRIYEKWFGPGTSYSFPMGRSLDIWQQ
ncbi:MAG: transporter substrate-binding domain-containing protein [Thermodesulfobacteriota bacterium]